MDFGRETGIECRRKAGSRIYSGVFFRVFEEGWCEYEKYQYLDPYSLQNTVSSAYYVSVINKMNQMKIDGDEKDEMEKEQRQRQRQIK